MTSDQVIKLFPGTQWELRETSSGKEVILKDCPLDLKNLGTSHPRWKTYVNPEKEVLKCFVCHSPGQGMKLSTVRRKLRHRSPSPNQIQKSMRKGVTELPPIPDGCIPITEIDPMPNGVGGIVHPCFNYLCLQREFPYEALKSSGFLWKPDGLPAWIKTDSEGKKIEVGTYPGLILPIRTRGDLVGWQLTAVPRKSKVPKYVTAPGSKLAGALYNFDTVVGRSSVVVVTEGIFDVLRIPEIGVALLTDNINKRKKRLLSTGGFLEVVLCLDSDRSEAHVSQELQKLYGAAPRVRAVKLESGDPGDYKREELMAILFGENHD